MSHPMGNSPTPDVIDVWPAAAPEGLPAARSPGDVARRRPGIESTLPTERLETAKGGAHRRTASAEATGGPWSRRFRPRSRRVTHVQVKTAWLPPTAGVPDAWRPPAAWRHPWLYDLASRSFPGRARFAVASRPPSSGRSTALSSHRRVLEVGSGTGWYTGAIASRCSRYGGRARPGHAGLGPGRNAGHRNVSAHDGRLPLDPGAHRSADGSSASVVLDYLDDLVGGLASSRRTSGGMAGCCARCRRAPRGALVDGTCRIRHPASAGTGRSSSRAPRRRGSDSRR